MKESYERLGERVSGRELLISDINLIGDTRDGLPSGVILETNQGNIYLSLEVTAQIGDFIKSVEQRFPGSLPRTEE